MNPTPTNQILLSTVVKNTAKAKMTGVGRSFKVGVRGEGAAAGDTEDFTLSSAWQGDTSYDAIVAR